MYVSDMILRTLFVALAPVLTAGNTRNVCNRDPPNTAAFKTPGDNGYRLKILGKQPDEGYTPGQVYTVTINGTYYNQKLLGFMLVAVPENAKDETVEMGTFQHFNDGLTKNVEDCKHIITHTYHHSKPGVAILWTAPPTGSGCVEFRASVIEHKDIWYKDDGALTKVFCEDTGLSEESTHTEMIPDCCACGVAKYQMTFHGIWSRHSHPKDFPKSTFLLHWSNIVGASHTKKYTPWQYGHYASPGVKEVCEYGDSRRLEVEMRNHSKQIRTVVKTTGIWVNLKQSRWARFSVNRTHHLMSMLTMLGPSPDWCVGVSALELCLPNCTWAGDQTIELLPWDAGTDNGVTYMSANSKTDPQEKIHHITNVNPEQSPFHGKNPIKPLARLEIRRIHPKPGMAASCNGNEQDNDDLDTFAGAEKVDSSSTDMDMKKKLMMMQKGKCATTEWMDWSGCSVTCGVGMRIRKRSYINPMVNEAMCGFPLMEKDNCIGVENVCERPDEDCAVTGWSSWSPCSVTCGKGVHERRRYYYNKMDMKRCNRKVAEIEMCIVQPMDCSNVKKNFTAICVMPKKKKVPTATLR